MDDLIERLLNAKPGARQEAAAEIRRLTASLAAMERERDAWKAAVESMRELRETATQYHHGNAEYPWVRVREELGAWCDAYDAARAATDAMMKQSPESATKEPPHA